MIELRHKNLIQNEMSDEDLENWFDFKKKKFLHNIDTFYYSVKFKNDFRFKTNDRYVKKLRSFFDGKYSQLQSYGDEGDFYLQQLGKNLVLKKVTFSRFYSICLSYPEYFDIFIAPVVPKASDGSESITCECIVQLRSYFLWQFGVNAAFENSYEYVKHIVDYFNLEIDFVQENRVDYCWHTNYLQNPEAFFEPNNFYKMRVDRFKNATYVTNKVGNEDYEIDYVALGKRSDKVFIRIYQKTREVIEQNYKPWFFKIWQLNGLINNYDLYVYEKAYKKRSWFYRYYARLEFYQEYGTDLEMLQLVNDILNGVITIEEQDLIELADRLTPKLNYIINIEYQTMRKHSKSYDLVPFKDRSNKGETKRIYDYFDNRKIIVDYLTSKTFRLVNYEPELKKSEREMCAFWKALRAAKCIDMKLTNENIKLVRIYNKKLSQEAVRKRFINSAVTLGLYVRGNNDDHPLQDAFEAMLRMNDNDIQSARRYKTKKLRQLNPEELAEVYESNELHSFQFLDEYTGQLYNYNTLIFANNQEGDAPDDSPDI